MVFGPVTEIGPVVATPSFFLLISYTVADTFGVLWFQLQLFWVVPLVDNSFACWHCLPSTVSLFSCSGSSLKLWEFAQPMHRAAQKGRYINTLGQLSTPEDGSCGIYAPFHPSEGQLGVAFDLFLRGFPVEPALVSPSSNQLNDGYFIIFSSFLSHTPHSLILPLWDQHPKKYMHPCSCLGYNIYTPEPVFIIFSSFFFLICIGCVVSG